MIENWRNGRPLYSADFALPWYCLWGNLLFIRKIKSTESDEEVCVLARALSSHLQNKTDLLMPLCIQ
jgi:hypothetical protein